MSDPTDKCVLCGGLMSDTLAEREHDVGGRVCMKRQLTAAHARINFLEQNETVVWETLKIPDGSTIHDVYAAIYKLHARIAELEEVERWINSHHNGYDPYARESMPELKEPATLVAALEDLMKEWECLEDMALEKYATEAREHATLRDGVKALATRCEQSSQGLSAIMPNGAAVYARMADELTALLGQETKDE